MGTFGRKNVSANSNPVLSLRIGKQSVFLCALPHLSLTTKFEVLAINLIKFLFFPFLLRMQNRDI